MRKANHKSLKKLNGYHTAQSTNLDSKVKTHYVSLAEAEVGKNRNLEKVQKLDGNGWLSKKVGNPTSITMEQYLQLFQQRK